MVARILGTCGGQFVFMLVSGAPAMAKLYPCLNRADLWWRHGIPACTWGTCGGTKRDLVKDRPHPSLCYQNRSQPKIDQLRLDGAKTDLVKYQPNPS